MERLGALVLFLALVLQLTVFQTGVHASDPDLTTDFNVTNPVADSFTFRGLTTVLGTQPPGVVTSALPTIAGLSGLALTVVFFSFGYQSQIDPHTHPRATELFYVLTGKVDVGFVDTGNNLFEASLNAGDLFVFPKGLLHWQRNNQGSAATCYSVLSSENPGTLLVTNALFTAGGKGLPDAVLSAAFGSNLETIDTIKKTLGDSATG